MTEDELREFLRDYLLARNGDGGDLSEWLSEYAQQRWNFQKQILWDGGNMFGYPKERGWPAALYSIEGLQGAFETIIKPELAILGRGYVQVADDELYRAVCFAFSGHEDYVLVLWSVYDDNSWKVMSIFGTNSGAILEDIKGGMSSTEELARLRHEERALESVRKKQKLDNEGDSDDDYWAMYDKSGSEQENAAKSDESMDEDEYFAQYDGNNNEEDAPPKEQSAYDRIKRSLGEAWSSARELGLSQSDFDQHVKECIERRDYMTL